MVLLTFIRYETVLVDPDGESAQAHGAVLWGSVLLVREHGQQGEWVGGLAGGTLDPVTDQVDLAHGQDLEVDMACHKMLVGVVSRPWRAGRGFRGFQAGRC